MVFNPVRLLPHGLFKAEPSDPEFRMFLFMIHLLPFPVLMLPKLLMQGLFPPSFFRRAYGH